MKILGLAMLAATMPLSAAPAAPTKMEAPSAAQVQAAERKAKEILGALDTQRMFSEPDYATRNRTAIEVLRPLVRNPDMLHAIDLLRQLSFLAEGRNDESLDLGKEMISRDPKAAHIYPTAIWAAVDSERAAEAADLVESAARHVKDPDGLAALRDGLDSDLIWAVLRPLREAKNDAARYRVAEAMLVISGTDRSASWLDGMRSIALDGRLAAGKVDEARALARIIMEPREVIRLAGARRYDALFGESEDRPALVAKAIADWDKATSDQFREKPGDLDVVLRRAQHLRSVGKNQEALDLLTPHTTDLSAIEKAGEPAFWIVNDAAYALGALGRHDDAIALMERLMTLPLEKHPALVSMAINHGAILAGAGRYREAVSWETALDAKPEKLASDYGHMWMWSTIACAESMIGNSQAAAPWLARLAASSDKNEAAHMRGLLCAEDMAGAEALLLKRLGQPDSDHLLIALHRYELGPDAWPGMKAVDDRLEILLERPAVKDAVAKIGRRLTLPLSKTYWGDN